MTIQECEFLFTQNISVLWPIALFLCGSLLAVVLVMTWPFRRGRPLVTMMVTRDETGRLVDVEMIDSRTGMAAIRMDRRRQEAPSDAP